MAESEGLPFLNCDDPEKLSPEDREKYITYWASRTPAERLCEMLRPNVIKYGLKPPYKMDKTRFEVIDMSKYLHEKN